MALERPVTFVPNLETPVRDGTILRCDMYRPEGAGPWPTVLARTPYDKQLADPARPWLRFASAGYAVLVQDCRGCCASEGEFVPFRDEGADGYDTIEWIAAQPWSTGKIAMHGTSYLGVTQWLAAAASPPHLTTIMPAFTASDYHDGWIYQSGALMLSFALGWALPFALRDLDRRELPEGQREQIAAQLRAAMSSPAQTLGHRPLADIPVLAVNDLAPYYLDWLEHPDDGDYWRRWRIADLHGSVTIPVLSFSGWYDMFLGGTISNFLGMQANGGSPLARDNQRLVIGSWAHGKPLYGGNPDPQVDFGPQSSGSAIDVDGIALRWLDHWLRGIENGVMDEPRVSVFTLGLNQWQHLQGWPSQAARIVDYFLHSAGAANTAAGDGRLSTIAPADEIADTYLYDPRRPVPTVGGRAFMNDGARDQRRIEERLDVLVYTSEPLTEDVEITGPVAVRLWAASSAVDTDFTAKLVDVWPDGFAMNLADNVIRARYRDSPYEAALLEPGRAYEYRIDLGAISAVLAPGHRIRLEISSSNFPRFDAHPNTGVPCAQAKETAPAVQAVYHEGSRPSRISLPLVSR